MAENIDSLWFMNYRKVDKVPGLPVPVGYTGNSDYCYANSLHMALLATGSVQPQDIPSPGFIECLTTVPFGKLFLELPTGPIAYFSSVIADPNNGLTQAIKTLGWSCQYRAGGDPEAALAALRSAVRYQPVLVGPLDMGFLTYNPHHQFLRGADHYVLVISINDEEGRVLLHDPKMFPYATVPIPDFMMAWKAEGIHYSPEPYVFRSHFKMAERPARNTMIARTVDMVRTQLAEKYRGPSMFSGAEALRRTAANLDKPTIRNELATFAFPLAARRAIDAAAFLDRGGLQGAALSLAKQAQLYGKAVYPAVHGQWDEVQRIILELAELEGDFEAEILKK